MSHVFLSYSRKDITIMQRVRDDLRAAGIAVWTDENLTPGTPSWRNAIEEAIENAGALVVLMSPDSKKSEWVEREISYATVCGVHIIPVLVRGSERTAVPIDLINIQRLTLEKQSPNSVSANKLKALIAQIQRSLDHHTSDDAGLRVQQSKTTRLTVEDLQTIFGFSHDELNLNRQGLLSERQRVLRRKEAFGGFACMTLMALLGVFGIVCIVIGLVAGGEAIWLSVCSGGGLLLLFWPFIDDGFEILRSEVRHVTGLLQRSDQHQKILVKTKELNVPEGAYSNMRGLYAGTYRAYFLAHRFTGPLLSIEPITEDTDS